MLSYLFPGEAAEIAPLASDAVESRVWAGIHYPSDVAAGRELGRKVAEKVIARAKADGADQ
jgi:membrane-associated phospholipid phosphatase